MNPTTPYQLDQTLSTSLTDLSTIFIAFLPQFFWALLIFVIGLVAAHWARSLTHRALRAINLDPLIHKFGVSQLQTEGEVRPRFEHFLTEIVYWFVIYLFLISVFSTLGVTSIAEFMQKLLSFLPNMLIALFIFLLSVILAGLAESFVKNAFSGFDIASSRLMAKITSYTVVVIGSLIALSELGIAEHFINILFIGFILTLSLGIGLAFGLGSKDLVSKILDNWYQRYSRPRHHNSKKQK